jgi:hypothetical protein
MIASSTPSLTTRASSTREILAQSLRSLRIRVQIAMLRDASTAYLERYFAWSLLDNFKWGHGCPIRFGLFRVESDEHTRTAKRSAHQYGSVVSAEAVDAPSISAEGVVS